MCVKPISGLTIYANEGSKGYEYAKIYGFKTGEVAYFNDIIPFIDIKKDAWYFGYIKDVFYKKYFAGVSDTEFAPDLPMTRAMFVTVLARINSVDLSIYQESHFEDVEVGEWYCTAVEWAYKIGIVSGIGDGKFSPDEYITREQICKILVCYADYLGFDTKCIIEPAFSDSDNINEWAYDSVGLAAEYGLIAGRGNNTFAPGASTTRAEAAVIILGFDELFIKGNNLPAKKEEGSFTITDGVLVNYYGNESRIIIPDGVISIGANAFRNQYITAVKIPDSVIKIDDYAFYNCANLSTLILPSTLRFIGNYAFSYCGFERIRIPAGVNMIGSGAFSSCAKLVDLKIEEGTKAIGYASFANCHALKSIIIPSTVNSIGEQSFSYCSSLESVDIKSNTSVLSVGDSAFKSCINLKSVGFTQAPKTMGENIFYHCTLLDSVTPTGINWPESTFAETPFGAKKTEYEPYDILIVGNSHTRTSELYNNISRISSGTGAPISVKLITIDGAFVNDFAMNPTVLSEVSRGKYDYLFLCGFYEQPEYTVSATERILIAMTGTKTKLVMFPAHNENQLSINETYIRLRDKVDLLNWHGLISSLYDSGVDIKHLIYFDGIGHAKELNGYGGACLIFSYLYGVMPIDALPAVKEYYSDRVPGNTIDLITTYAYWYAKDNKFR